MLENAMENLKNNLLVIGVLLGLFILGYCKWKGVSFKELIKEIKELTSKEDE